MTPNKTKHEIDTGMTPQRKRACKARVLWNLTVTRAHRVESYIVRPKKVSSSRLNFKLKSKYVREGPFFMLGIYVNYSLSVYCNALCKQSLRKSGLPTTLTSFTHQDLSAKTNVIRKPERKDGWEQQLR